MDLCTNIKRIIFLSTEHRFILAVSSGKLYSIYFTVLRKMGDITSLKVETTRDKKELMVTMSDTKPQKTP